MRATKVLTVLAAALLFSEAASAAEPQPITPVACLRKMSLDLTNRGPSAQDIADLKSGAKSLGALADAYLASSRFNDVVFDWIRGWFAPTPKVPAGTDIEEPARIARYLVANDLDFREMVTAGYTVNASGAKATAGSDAAGVLST